MDKIHDIKINDVYLPYLNNTDRYQFYYGGSGSGKSVFAAQKIILLSLSQPRHRWVIFRKIGATLKDSVFKLFSDLITEYDLSYRVKINKTDMSFIFDNGSEILTKGLDDQEKLKSIQKPTGAWVEEITELDEMDYNQIDLRLRGDSPYPFQLIGTFNPISETHWLKTTLLDKNIGTWLQTTYKNNYYIDEQYKQVLTERIAGNENLKRIYVDGLWGRIRTGAEFYSEFRFNHHVQPIEDNGSRIYHLSFDQNVVPYVTAIVAQISKVDDLYYLNILQEYTLKNPKNKTEYICLEFDTDYQDRCDKIFVYGDASGRHGDTRENRNDYEIIETRLRKYVDHSSNRVPRANPGLIKRRSFINRCFQGVMPIHIRVHPRCKELINDLESVVEDVDGGKLKKKTKDKSTGQSYEEHGHASDCLDYLLCEAFRSYFNQKSLHLTEINTVKR